MGDVILTKRVELRLNALVAMDRVNKERVSVATAMDVVL